MSSKKIPAIQVRNRTIVLEEEKLQAFTGWMQNQFRNNRKGSRIIDQKVDGFPQEMEENEDSGEEEKEEDHPEKEKEEE